MSVLFQNLSVWKKLEKNHKKKYNEAFPKCIKTLLIGAAFDSSSSLSNITADSITDIQRNVNNHREILNNLNCCYSDKYKDMVHFEFLPGHRTMISNIPSLLNIQAKNPWKNHKKKQTKSEVQVTEQLLNLLQRTLVKAAQENNRGNVDAPMISEGNLYDFRQDDTSENETIYKCRFICPYCDETFALSYRKFWISSKVTKHIKNHMG